MFGVEGGECLGMGIVMVFDIVVVVDDFLVEGWMLLGKVVDVEKVGFGVGCIELVENLGGDCWIWVIVDG